jgi:hypothetical protein
LNPSKSKYTYKVITSSDNDEVASVIVHTPTNNSYLQPGNSLTVPMNSLLDEKKAFEYSNYDFTHKSADNSMDPSQQTTLNINISMNNSSNNQVIMRFQRDQEKQ